MLLKQKIYFFFEDVKVDIRNRSLVKKCIEQIFRKEARQVHFINYIFCTDKKILKINRQFLNHNYFTDIITFDLSEENGIEADIYISIDRIKENSKIFKSSIKTELYRVIVHGALHLCGYNDKNKKEKLMMRQKEEFYLAKYFSFHVKKFSKY